MKKLVFCENSVNPKAKKRRQSRNGWGAEFKQVVVIRPLAFILLLLGFIIAVFGPLFIKR